MVDELIKPEDDSSQSARVREEWQIVFDTDETMTFSEIAAGKMPDSEMRAHMIREAVLQAWRFTDASKITIDAVKSIRRRRVTMSWSSWEVIE